MHKTFSIFPAIDLRQGQVVRLKEGDPLRQTQYSDNPAETAQTWLDAGSSWLHVVNLDGAFGDSGHANQLALRQIIEIAKKRNAAVQFGGGLRDLKAVEAVFDQGVSRVMLGTLVIEAPQLFQKALEHWGPQKIAVSIDARSGIVQTRGWQQATQIKVLDMALSLKEMGLLWLVFTDISRDGLQTGFNLDLTCSIAATAGINVIASGGVRGEEDIFSAHDAGLAGIIIGRALYEGKINLNHVFEKVKG